MGLIKFHMNSLGFNPTIDRLFDPLFRNYNLAYSLVVMKNVVKSDFDH